jgi:hypothetical protein
MSERFDSTSHLAEESRVMSTLADSNSHAETVTAVDDAAKLKMLGYDTVLGRPLGFWSSMGMSVAYLGVLYDWRLNSFIYGYHAPLAFVSTEY